MLFSQKNIILLPIIIVISGCEPSNIDIKKSYKQVSTNLSKKINTSKNHIVNKFTELRTYNSQDENLIESEQVEEIENIITNLEEHALEKVPYDFSKPFDSIIFNVISQHPEVQSAIYSLKAAEQEVIASESENRPQITGSLNAGGVSNNIGSSSIKPGLGLNAAISKVIYDGGYIAGGIGKQVALLEKSKANADLAKNRIGFKATSAWINLWVLREKLKEVNETLKDVNPILVDIKRMAESGLIDRTIVDNIENSLLKITLDKQKLKIDKDLSELHFENFFGNSPSKLILPKSTYDVDIFKLKMDNVATIPSLRLTASDLVASREEIKSIKGEFKPKVSFNISANSPTDPDDNASLAVGINSTYTFSDGGRLKARLKVAQAKSSEIKFALESSKIETTKSIESDIKSLDFLEQSRSLSQMRLTKNLESLAILKSQILTGQSRLNNLIDMHIEKVGITNNLLDNTAQHEIAKYSLAAILGIFSELKEAK